MAKTAKSAADYILPLYMNGLSGRMLRMPPPKNTRREILFIYGHHASLERHFGVAEFLNKYAGVTVPDLPGFGGMDSFYKIGERPSLDNLADYLAAFIKLRYQRRRFIIAGYSLGVIIITRMLQKYPDLAKRVDMVVSIAGFANKGDFAFKRRNFWLMRWGSSLLSHRLPSAIAKYIFLRGPFIRAAYRIGETISFNAKTATLDDQGRRNERINFEIGLWRANDFRTYMVLAVTMFTLDLGGKHINLPIHHASVSNDHYFNQVKVEEHMRQIYSDFIHARVKAPTHSPSVVATAKDAEPFIPKKFLRLMIKKIKV